MSVIKRLFSVVRAEIRDKLNSYESTSIGDEDPPRNHQKSQRSYAKPQDVHDREAAYYANLELKPGADFKAIKASYRKLIKQYHPDLYQSDIEKSDAARRVTQELNDAYEYFRKKLES